MSKIKLVTLDIDDTLLDDNQIISEANVKAIHQAIDLGVKVVLCSGRTHTGMKEYLDKLGINGNDQYIITNGGSIIESVAGDIIYKKTLSNKTYREIDAFIQKNELHYNVVDVLGNTFTSNNDFIDPYTVIQAFENGKGLFIRTPDQLPENFEITKAIINENKIKLDSIEDSVNQRFGQNYYIFRTGDGFLEIMPKNIDKGSALASLADFLKIDISETMAIGDGENDIPMLKKAGISIAMGNSKMKIKNMVDFVTSNNNESGVAEAFSKYVLK